MIIVFRERADKARASDHVTADAQTATAGIRPPLTLYKRAQSQARARFSAAKFQLSSLSITALT
jgi:hypothetical protein